MSDLIPWVTLWFVMTNSVGYTPPMEVRVTDTYFQCGLTGAVVGLQINRLEDPTVVSWPGTTPDTHCEVDVAARVATMPPGEYHFATTEMGVIGMSSPYNIDPHTSVYWIRSNNEMAVVPTAKNVRVAQ